MLVMQIFLLFALIFGVAHLSTAEDTGQTGWDGGNICLGRYTYGVTPGKPSLVEFVEDYGNGTCRLVNYDRKIAVYVVTDGTFDNAHIYTFDCNAGPSVDTEEGFGMYTDAFYYMIAAHDMFVDSNWGRLKNMSKNEWINIYGLKSPTAYSGNHGIQFSVLSTNLGEAAGKSQSSYASTMGHEFGHMFDSVNGLTHVPGGGEATCFFQAIADITAVWFLTYLNGEDYWCFGKDCDGSCGRDLRNEKGEYSDYFGDCEDGTTNCPSNSGCNRLPRYAFATLATSPGWDVRTAGQAFLWAVRFLWSNPLTIKESGCAVRSIVKQMKINNGDIDAVNNAYETIGVNLADCPTASPTFNLLNCEPFKGWSAETGEQVLYKVVAPTCSISASLTFKASSGNVTLYIKKEEAPTEDVYDYKYSLSPEGTLNVPITALDRDTAYYLMVHAEEAYRDLELGACFSTAGCTLFDLKNCEGSPGWNAEATAQTVYTVVAPAGSTSAHITLRGTNGNAQLYVKKDEPPTKSVFDYNRLSSNSNETLKFTTPALAADTVYHVMVSAKDAYSDLEIYACFSSD